LLPPKPEPFGLLPPKPEPFGLLPPKPEPFGLLPPKPEPFGLLRPKPEPFGLLGPGPVNIGKAAEVGALRQFDPNATGLPENFKAYDGVSGGTRDAQLVFDRRSKKWVVNETITGGNWIGVKKVLEKGTATPEHVTEVVERALNDMFDAEHNPQRLAAHDPTPVDVGPTAYWRVIKNSPGSVTVLIQVSKELSETEVNALQAAASNAAAKWPSLGDLPPVSVRVMRAP
jgi:hypothetical protein